MELQSWWRHTPQTCSFNDSETFYKVISQESLNTNACKHFRYVKDFRIIPFIIIPIVLLIY